VTGTDRSDAGASAALPPGDRDALVASIAQHPFTAGLAGDHLQVLAEHAHTVEVAAGRFVFRQGSPADALYLLLDGDVDLEVAGGGDAPLVLESLHGGDALGWSWLFADQPWLFDAHARSATQAVAVDGHALRTVIDADPVFGRDLTRRVAALVTDRLRHARLALVDSWTHDRRA
jgi:CRP/FNR family transcriptional regulator, cyclic AMP receptor protein